MWYKVMVSMQICKLQLSTVSVFDERSGIITARASSTRLLQG